MSEKEEGAQKNLRIVIFGKVQGVFFRSNLKVIADSLSVTVWTRNVADGTVEVVVQGRQEDLQRVTD